MADAQLQDWDPRKHRFITFRQYAMCAASAVLAAAIVWIVTRPRSSPALVILVLGLLGPLGYHRDRFRPRFHVAYPFILAALMLLYERFARSRGWIS